MAKQGSEQGGKVTQKNRNKNQRNYNTKDNGYGRETEPYLCYRTEKKHLDFQRKILKAISDISHQTLQIF